MIQFQDVPYLRPDMDAMEAEMNAGISALEGAKTFPEAYYALLSLEAPRRKFMTLATLVEAQNTMNTNDEFWASEQAWFDRIRPRWDALCVRLGEVLNATSFRKDFELHLGTEIFRQAEVTGRAFSTEIASDLEEDSVLSAKYSKISGNLSVEVDGKRRTMGELSRIAKPEAAVITNVGTSHLEVYGTREKLLEEKLRVSTGFTLENTLVINTDSDILTKENAQRHQPSDARIVTVGSKGGEDYHLSDIRDRGIEGVQCNVTHGDETVTLKLPVIGAHNLGNAVLAMAIGEVFGITMEESVEALCEVETNANRLSVVKGTDYSVINDPYNASPESMKAGIDVLVNSPGKRKIAVLGSMFELGDHSEQLHRSVGEYAASKPVDILVAIGENGKAIAEGGESASSDLQVLYYEDREDAAKAVRPMLQAGDLVYVKASRSMELEKFVTAITE